MGSADADQEFPINSNHQSHFCCVPSMSPEHFLETGSHKFLILEKDQYYALENMKACRTIDKGGRILHCRDCGTEVILYNPCNQRGCPKCSKKNQIIWAEKLKGKLLPIGHYHLIFSVPPELTDIWKADKSVFINSFFHSVQQAFKKHQQKIGLTLGIIMVFQSHGHGLCFKPHIHCIVTNHGIDQNNRWLSYPTPSYNDMENTLKETMIPHLKKKLHPYLRNHFKKELDSCNEKKWSVYPAYHKFNGESIVNYLSKSVSGMVIDIENDLDFSPEEEIFTIRDRHMGKERTTTLDVNTLYQRYLSHIPPKGAVTIRNYGLYSNRYRDVLERIRIDEYRLESPKEEEGDYEEECSACHGMMETKEVFTINELPLVIRLFMKKNNGPPKHGFSFPTQKLVLS